VKSKRAVFSGPAVETEIEAESRRAGDLTKRLIAALSNLTVPSTSDSGKRPVSLRRKETVQAIELGSDSDARK
jgi:hypothetical protein